MDQDLLQKLVNDPGRWPAYLAFAVSMWFLFKLTSLASDYVWSHLLKSLKSRTGLRRSLATVLQILVLTVAAYLFNALYWSRHLPSLMTSCAVIAHQLSLTDQAVLMLRYENAHPELSQDRRLEEMHNRIKTIMALPREMNFAEIMPALKNLVRFGLIDDVPYTPNTDGKVSFSVNLTKAGTNMCEYLLENLR